MKLRHVLGAAACLAGLVTLFLPQFAAAELVARLVTDPRPTGPAVTMSDFVFEGSSLATARFAVKNASTNLLSIDSARSSLTVSDGEARPLGALLGTEFVRSLLPGVQTSDTLDILTPVQVGDQMKLHLVWTLGAIVDSATWVWQIADPSAPPAPVAPPAAPPTTVKPAPPAPAPTTPTTTEAPVAADSLLGLIALVAGLAIVGLLAWGIWALTR